MDASPVARRATLHLVDDFGIPADQPRFIADLLLALEEAPFGPVVIIARGEYGAPDRVRVDHGGEVWLLTPADARLTAAALDGEQAFAGCSGVAAQLREAALRIDFGAPPPTLDTPSVGEPRDSAAPVTAADGLRSAARTLLAVFALLVVSGALMAVAAFVPGRA